MVDTAPISLSRQVKAAQNYAHTIKGADVRNHYLWMVKQLTGRIRPADLTTEELISLTALLIPAHSRLVGFEIGAPSTKVLRLVRNRD